MKQFVFIIFLTIGLTQFACGQESSNKNGNKETAMDVRGNNALSQAKENSKT